MIKKHSIQLRSGPTRRREPMPFTMPESIFFSVMQKKIDEGSVLPCMKDDPEILGQVVHEVFEGCCVYLMLCKERASESWHLKIGLAKNIQKRLCSHMTDNPLDVLCVYYFCIGPYGDTRKFEIELHKKFSTFNSRGEWFYFESESGLEEAIVQASDHLKERLGIHYNVFIYRPDKAKDESIKSVRKFVSYAWEHSQKRLYGAEGPRETYEGGGYATMNWGNLDDMNK